MPDNDLIGTAEAERLLGISRATLIRRIEAGEVPSVGKLPGAKGVYVFRRNVIEALAEGWRVAKAS